MMIPFSFTMSAVRLYKVVNFFMVNLLIAGKDDYEVKRLNQPLRKGPAMSKDFTTRSVQLKNLSLLQPYVIDNKKKRFIVTIHDFVNILKVSHKMSFHNGVIA